MKYLIGFVLCLTVGVSVQAAKSKARYPQIESVVSPAFQVDERIIVTKRQAESSEVEKVLKVKAVLKDKAVLRTGEKGEMRIALGSQKSLHLGEKAEVEFPAIDWEKGAVPVINVRQGEVRFICQSDCETKFITPLYEGVGTSGDFILRYDPAIPLVELTVLQGEMPFRGLENEMSTAVMAGQKISFKGVLENGEPAYDILLKGRKVAKGKMSEIEQIPAARVQELLKQEEKRKKVAKLSPKSKRKAAQICDKPWGELNQCAWTCENNPKNAKECLVNEGATCVRQRCNANGDWSDRQELPAQTSPCQIKQFVGVCDY